MAEEMEAKLVAWDGVLRLPTKTVDINKVMPLRISDWKRLKENGITIKSLSSIGAEEGPDFDKLTQLILYVVNKVDSKVTAQELDDTLTMQELMAVVNFIIGAERNQVDRPT